MCVKDSFEVGYDITGTVNPGNTFKVYLSNASGDFAAETEIGAITSTDDNLLTCKIPAGITDGNGYKLRVKSSNPELTSEAGPYTLTLYDRPFIGNDTTLFVVCATELVNLSNVYNTAGYSIYWNTQNPNTADTGVYWLIAINGNGCSDTVNMTVAQDVATWVGNSSNNWHTPANWSAGRIPTAVTHVIIPAGTPNNCVLSESNGAAASVQVRPGATMQVINSRVIVISGKCSPLPPG